MDFYLSFFLNFSPKRYDFLEFLFEKKEFHISKRALGAGTARNKRLK